MLSSEDGQAFKALSRNVLYPFPFNILSILATAGFCLYFYATGGELTLVTDVEELWGNSDNHRRVYLNDLADYKAREDPDKVDDESEDGVPAYPYCDDDACERQLKHTHLLLHLPENEGADVLTQEFLIQHYELLTSILHDDLNVEMPIWNEDDEIYENRTFFYRDVCDKIDAPDGLENFYHLIPCNRMTVLDCFQEGGFDFVSPSELNLLWTYLTIIAPDPELKSMLQDYYGIKGYEHLPSIYDMTDDEIKEQVSNGCKGWVTNIEAMQWPTPAIVGGTDPKEFAEMDLSFGSAFFTQFIISDTKKTAPRMDISLEESAVVTKMLEAAFSERIREHFWFQGTTVRYLRHNALYEILNDVSEQNIPLLVKGLILMGSFCILSMISKMVFLPILSLIGLAVVFLSVNTTYWIMAALDIPTNVTTNSVLPFLAIGMGVDDMFILLRMFQKTALEEFGGVTSGSDVDSIKIQPLGKVSGHSCLTVTMSEVGRSMTLTSVSNFFAFMLASMVPVLAVSSFCQSCAVVVAVNYIVIIFLFAPIVGIFERTLAPIVVGKGKPDPDAADAEGGGGAKEGFGMMPCRLQQSAAGKGLALGMKAILLVTAAVGVAKIEYGLSIADIAPSDSDEYLFTEVFQREFSFQPIKVRTGNTYADIGGRQQEFIDTIELIEENEYVLQVMDYWLPAMVAYLNTSEVCPSEYKPVDGLVPVANYTEALEWWISKDSLSVNIIGKPYMSKKWLPDRRQLEAVVDIYLYNLWETSDYTKMIGEVEAILAKTGARSNIYDPTYDELSLFGMGVPFTFFEQYMTLDKYGLQVGCLAMLGVWFVGIVSGGIYCGTVMMFVVATMMLELLGFIGFAGLKFSALPMVTVLSCIGISVEFVGHISSSYGAASGDANDRIEHVYTHVYLPIIDGSVSTILAVLMLGSSDFNFVRLYFFLPYVAIVVIGLINGLVVLPVLLSLGWNRFGGKGKRSLADSEVAVGPGAAPEAGSGGGVELLALKEKEETL